MEGGRFDFSDGGSYVGEWSEGRAHGLGIATGPDNQGEYSGEWTMGFESRGVYIWPSGNIYSGTWLKGKRHGEGVQVKGRWIYRGAFTTGFCGRYGVKESLTSCAKYEGSWHLNQFDGFGVETNSDGSVYAGAWSRGMRQGLGVRRSAPYALAAEFNRTVRAAQSQNSLPSGTDSERGWRGTGSIGGGSGGDVRSTTERGRPDERRSGFVLRSISCPSPASQTRSTISGYRSGPSNSEKKSTFGKGLFRKLRKQKSTGDLSIVGGHSAGGLSSLGCGTGSGGFFHGRGRRAGGSLRSTLSASSQLTTNSLGRGELKTLGNGGQGLHEIADEQLGPGVTETYSGQWNEDRRSGYGIAERSDGLKYVGEWFNNKKDGYGVTYQMDGTKEEGKYKENILVQALNRKSKLFVLRHTKLRDAIEEAVKNAEDASRKAQENASESAYQRAQTARMVAKTADERARVARKLSDEARAVAREFSPEFVQLGLEWEKQNPLLKKELFGVTKDTPDSESANRQLSRSVRMERPVNGEGLTGNSLEVSGGSRQGSFRSSFRRHGTGHPDAHSKDSNKRSADSEEQRHRYDGGTYSPELSRDNLKPTSFGSRSRNVEALGQLRSNPSDPHMLSNNLSDHRSPAGRPIARAATTGVAGIGYAQADHKHMAEHMAQHPHSPYLMPSQSQHLDNFVEPETAHTYEGSRRDRTFPRTGTAKMNEPSVEHSSQSRAHGGRVTTTSANSSKARAHRAYEIRIEESNLIEPNELHYATIQMVHGPNPEVAKVDHLADRVDHDYGTVYSQEMGFNEKFYPSESINQVRRRTLPSIVSEPLKLPNKRSQPVHAGKHRAATLSNTSHSRRSRTITNEDDAIHSAENLPACAAETYIIENGIRKRVQAVTRMQQARMQATQKLPEDEEKEGRRPEWTTAYDPYRPAMESTMVLQQLGTPPPYTENRPQTSDQPPLPRAYRIDSQVSLLSGLKDTSLPDLPSACFGGTHGLHRRGQQRFVGMTREELSRLTQARRLELMAEMERRKKGEIVIRLADIKDWIRDNFVIVFVLLVNASLAFLFFNLLTGSTSPTTTTDPQSSAGVPVGSVPTAQTVKLTRKLVSEALKKAKAKFGVPGGAS